METLHKMQKMFLELLSCCALSGFSTTWKDGKSGTCFAFAVSYRWDIVQAKEWSCVLHGTIGQKFCVKFFVYFNDIEDLRTGKIRMDTGATKVQNREKEIFGLHKSLMHLAFPGEEADVKRSIEFALRRFSLTPLRAFLQVAKLIEEGEKSSLYCIFFWKHYIILAW